MKFRSLTTLRPAALAKRYEALIFDKDGTLLDFAATWDRGIAEALSRVAADKRRLAAEALGFDLDAGRALRDAACVHLPNEVLVTMLEPITDARGLTYYWNPATDEARCPALPPIPPPRHPARRPAVAPRAPCAWACL